MRSRVVACVAVAALWTGILLAQTPSPQPPGGPAPQGLIAGRVVDASTGQPLAGVTVSVGGGNISSQSVIPSQSAQQGTAPLVISGTNLLTGPDGQFSFRGLGRGSFTIAARRSGYIPGGFGVMRPGGGAQAISLEAGEQRTDVVVRLFRYASITGTVVDDSGEPLVSVRVVAARRVLAGGRRVSGQIAVATTDDRGLYRFGSVAPGEYIVSVPVAQTSVPSAGRAGSVGTFASRDQRFVSTSSVGSLAALPDAAGRLLSYATTYFPSARSTSQATPVVLSSGEERHGVDIVLSLMPTATVSGRLAGVPPQGGAPIQLRLSVLDAADAINVPTELDAPTATADADGSFTFFAVPAGRYVLQTSYLPQMEARPPATGGAPLPGLAWASVPLTVGADDVTDLVVTTQPGLAISGRIEFEGSLPAEGVRVSASVTALDGSRGLSSSSYVVNPGAATRSFAMSARQPGRYALTATASPGGWALKSIVAGGLDVTDGFDLVDRDLTDIVITFTKQPSTIGGTVRTAEGTPDSQAVVLVFPSDSKYWQDYGPNPRRLTSARASQKGTFGPAPMPPGDYYVIAIAEEASDEWQDLRTLERLARQSTRVTVTEGQQVTVDLTRRNVDPRTGFAHPAYRTYPAYLAYPGLFHQIRDTRAALRSGTGSVSGVVRSNDESSRPIPRARVSMRPIEGRQDYATLTDPAGRFTFPEIPQGRYTMTVTKPAYLTAHYGTGEGVLPPGLPISVAEGQRVTDIALRLTRGGVISGVVVDEFGGPVFGASIQVWQPMEGGDWSRLARLVVQGSPITDDRGVYRIYGLQPGSFAVSANLLGAGQDLRLASNLSRAVTYAPIFHPGTPVASDAAFVRVAPGQEVGGIDIPMRLVPTSRVEGTVTRSDGQPLKYVHVQLISQTPFQVPGAQTATGLTQQDARTTSFWFGAIPPGRYTAVARAEDQRPATARSGVANPLVWAQQEMDLMGDDVSGIALVLQPALTVSGRVLFEGTTSGALYGAGDLRVLATGSGVASTAAAQPPVEVDADGRFTFANLVPGEYRVTASALSLPGNAPVGIWSLVSAMSGGRDLLDYPLEVRPGQPVPEIVLTYTNQTSELTGRLLDAAGKPIVDLAVLLFTADRGLWMPGSRRVRAPARPAGDGTFRFYNLPPGEYFLGVATDLDPKDAADPSFLERLAPAAIRVTIAPGEKKVQDLRIAGPPLFSALAGRSATPPARGR